MFLQKFCFLNLNWLLAYDFGFLPVYSTGVANMKYTHIVALHMSTLKWAGDQKNWDNLKIQQE